jgi:hypothetical protein
MIIRPVEVAAAERWPTRSFRAFRDATPIRP